MENTRSQNKNYPAAGALYVGDLDKTVDEGLLYQLFSRFGTIASIRVCRDSVSRKSLGYAYVNFVASLDSQAAQKAMEVLNYTMVRNKPIRIMKAQRDAETRKSGVGNIFVKGLDVEIDSRTLHDTFEVFGPIASAKVALDDDGNPLGYGYVQYETAEAATAAVERANGMLLKGRQLYVAPYRAKAARMAAKGFTNLYIKHFPSTVVDEDSFKELFTGLGKITSVYLPRDENGAPRGFGFVNFSDPKEASNVVTALDKRSYDGTNLYVAPAQKKSFRNRILREKFEQIKRDRQRSCQGRNLYVKHISLDLDDKDLHSMFEKFGTITSSKIMVDEQGQSRGFGFVCFSTSEEASNAVKEMNGKTVEGQQMYVAEAQTKAARQAELSKIRMATLGLGGLGANPYSQVNHPGMLPPGALWPALYGPQSEEFGGRGNKARGTGGRGGRGRMIGDRGRSQRSVQGRGEGPFPGSMNPSAMGPSTFPGGSYLYPNMMPSFPQQSPSQQKVALGESLYPHVLRLQPKRAAKITGMLLEMPNADVQALLQNPSSLEIKVEEAMTVLNESGMLDDEME
eukprot:g2234.t1